MDSLVVSGDILIVTIEGWVGTIGIPWVTGHRRII